MKKFISCLLAFAMLTCPYSPAFALESKMSSYNRIEESIKIIPPFASGKRLSFLQKSSLLISMALL